jgi:DNA-binding transcriptional regulator WhiA
MAAVICVYLQETNTKDRSIQRRKECIGEYRVAQKIMTFLKTTETMNSSTDLNETHISCRT